MDNLPAEQRVLLSIAPRYARLIEAHLQAHLDVRTFDRATEPAVVELLDQIHAALADTAPEVGS